MWLLLILCMSLMFCNAERPQFVMCDIKSVVDLEEAHNCTHLRLYSNDTEIMKHAELFEKIKTVTTIFKLKLFNTSLTNISDVEAVSLEKGSTLYIVDNPYLEKLPDFNIVDGKRVNLFVINNPKLNTSQLLEECKIKKCPNATINKIQKPYTCTFSLPLSPSCRFIFGGVDLQGYDESLDQIEVIYGTLILNETNVTLFPKLANLRRLVQNPGNPLLVVENNLELTDMKALYNTTLDIDDIQNAVRISGNPKLCKTKKEANETFVVKYLDHINFCKEEPAVKDAAIKSASMDNGFDFKRLIFSRSSGTIGCWAAALIYSLLLNLVNL